MLNEHKAGCVTDDIYCKYSICYIQIGLVSEQIVGLVEAKLDETGFPKDRKIVSRSVGGKKDKALNST